MQKETFIFLLTYSFDGNYIAKRCDSYDDAMILLNEYLEKEIKTVRQESGYEPSVIKDADDDVTLIYAEGVTKNTHEYDCAYYRIFKV